MKRIVLLSAVFVLSLLGGVYGGELRIVYIDLQKALNNCDAGVKAKDELQKEARKKEEELNARQEELKGLRDEIEKKRTIWNKETLRKKEEEFRRKSQEFQNMFMRYGEELNKKKQEMEDRILKELKKIVEDIATKEGYTYVFERSRGGILHAPSEADITDRVIEVYNKVYREKNK